MSDKKKRIGIGTLDIFDLSDAIISGDKPASTEEGQLWIDTSKNPPVLMVYHNGNWQIQHLDVLTMDDGLKTDITTITETLGSITNDNKLSYNDRIIIANELNRVIGRITSTKNVDNFVDGLPNITEIDTLGLGSLATVRESAVMLDIEDSDSFIRLEESYGELTDYLESLKEDKGINIWDITAENAMITIDIDGDEFREKWLTFYNDLLVMEGKILSVPGPAGKPGISVILTNESITVSTDDNGENGDYSRAFTDILIYEGTNEVTDEWTISVSDSDGVVGTLNGNRYIVEEVSDDTDNGIVTFKASSEGHSDLVRRLTVSKSKTGTAAINDWIQVSSPIFSKDVNYVYTPLSVTAEAKRRIGGADILDLSGVFRIYEFDGVQEVMKYNTLTDNIVDGEVEYQSSVEWTPKSTNIHYVKFEFLEPTGKIIDVQTVVIVADGSSDYLWVRYSAHEDGKDMSTDPTGAEYIGVAVTRTTPAPSDPEDYLWSKFVGKDGIPGEDGSQLHIKYSDDGGKTFTDNNGEDTGTWIGICIDFEEEDSNDPSDYTWNRIGGIDTVSGYLTNETMIFPANSDGEIINYGGSQGRFIVYDGVTDVTDRATFEKFNEKNVTLTLLSNGSYEISLMSSDLNTTTGSVSIRATFGEVVIEKEIKVTKSMAGHDGVSYWLSSSSNVVVRHHGGSIDPRNLRFNLYSQRGSRPVENYEGRFEIQTSTDGEEWEIVPNYPTTEDLSTITYTVSTNDNFIKVIAYKAGGTDEIIDEETIPVIQEIKGEDGYTPVKGTDYFDGKDGQDGVASYLWVRYSEEEDGDPMLSSPVGAKYVGIAVTTTPNMPDKPEDYNWTLIKGADGIHGDHGLDGESSYLHIKYSNDGGESFTSNNGENVGMWIGIYVDDKKEDSDDPTDYEWNKVVGEDGEDGRAITLVDVEYAQNESPTDAPKTGWQTLAPDWKDGHYIWSRTKTSYSTGNPTYSEAACITGQKGSDGRGIESITEQFYLSTSNEDQVGGSWVNTPPLWEEDTYMWTRSKIVYKNPTITEYTEPTMDGNLTDMYSRITDAEIKILPDAIVHTVRSSEQYKDDMDPNTIISRINQTDTTVQIDAKNINLNGKITIKAFDQSLIEELDNKATKDYADSRKITSDTEPEDKSVIWIDTSNPDNPLWKVWDKDRGRWILGPGGPKGEDGTDGTDGKDGLGIESIIEYYLAASVDSGITIGSNGWTTNIQKISSSKKYLWNYEKIEFDDGSSRSTEPVIIGTYGEKGDDGRSITGITEYYLATSSSSGVTRSTSGWTTTMQMTDETKKYLWNYEKVTWSSSPTETFSDPIIIGTHGTKGEDGKDGIQGPPGFNGTSQYVHIRYSVNSNGDPMTNTPNANSKYIGITNTNNSTAPGGYSSYTWSLIKGEDGRDGGQGIQGPPGSNGQTTYTWVRYADDDKGKGISSNADSKRYIGLAFNKTSPNPSNQASDYQWSPMFGNVEIYRVVSKRYNGPYHTGAGLYDEGGTKLAPIGTDRSYILSVYNRNQKKWDSHKTYDLYHFTDGVDEAISLMEDLNALDNTKLIILIGSHAPANNRLTDGLPEAIYRCGGSSGIFESSKWDTPHPSYILIGIPGMGEGAGTEYFAHADIGWLDIQVLINNGNIQFEGYNDHLQDQIDEKASDSDLENLGEIVSDIGSQIDSKTDISDFEAIKEEFYDRMEQDIKDKEQIIKDLESIEGRTTLVDIILKEQKLTIDAINKSFSFSDDGLYVSSEGGSTGILIGVDRMSFIDGGTEVAFISNETMEITHGIFVESATISGFHFEKIKGTEILAITWVG